jgi:hypothetical protein
MLIIASKDVIQPAMVAIAERKPKRALWLKTSSMFGPGVADTTKVIKTKSHQLCKLITSLLSKSQVKWLIPHGYNNGARKQLH